MAMLAQHDIHLAGNIHDTMVTARVIDSALFPNEFSLANLAGNIGYDKDDAVKSWLLLTHCFTEEISPGKKAKKKNLHYSLAPWDLIVPYGERDAEITWKLAESQLEDLQSICTMLKAAQLPADILKVYENERTLVRTVYEMEASGVLIDSGFCRRAIEASATAMLSAEAGFKELTGEDFKDSHILFRGVFETDKERWIYGDETPTGKTNPSFDSEVLATFVNPAAAFVLRWRKAKSDVNYFHGFLHSADSQGVIHANFNQHATATGRFSSSQPNLQNLTKDDETALEQEFVVRRAIVPRPGTVFHMLDFLQMEYRLMLDYAGGYAVDDEGVLALIGKVLGGLDVHQATADVAGCSRRDAKTVNFATLYGSGVANLASRLAVPESRARAIRDSIFRAAPEIAIFIRRAAGTAEKRGYLCNWLGRRYLFPDATYAYRAPNYLIQGGCADIVKVAMNRIAAYLKEPGIRTRLVLMIHDELVLEGPPEESAEVIPRVQNILESVYAGKYLPLLCSVEHSFKSLADKVEGIACLTN